MKRSSSKKSTERRRKPRSGASAKLGKPSARKDVSPDACHNCGKKLSGEGERALFVEEEVGRIFCSESCIASYFAPEIGRLEKEYFRRLTPADLSGDERDALAHLRWVTLQEPDEIWREKTLSGDHRYTLISEFRPGPKKIWSICICLFLRGEPSFLYLAVTTRNAAMVNHYRRGEQVEWAKRSSAIGATGEEGRGSLPVIEREGLSATGAADQENASEPTDRLADPWTADETRLAQMNQERSPSDIRPDDYVNYQPCLEPTLEAPDEVWSTKLRGGHGPKIYHFIRHFPEERLGIWYVIVARETDEEEQIEILDAFPTRDRHLIESYRQGEQEVGEAEAATKASVRVVH